MLINTDCPHHQLMIIVQHHQSEFCACTDVICDVYLTASVCVCVCVCVCFMYRTSEEMKMTECAAYATHKPHYTDEYEHVTMT